MKKECEKPTKKYPNGRAGTSAGVSAHKKAKEKACEACAEFRRVSHQEYIRRNKDKKKEYDRRYREKHDVELKAKKKEYYDKNAEAIRDKSRKWHHENKERANAYSREYRKSNPDQVREVIARWHENNEDYVKERAAKWREKNRESMRTYMKKYYRANAEKWEGSSRRRRALKESQPHEPYTREEVVALHGSECYLCGGEVDMSLSWGNDRSPAMDHRWPISVPGGPGDVLINMWVTHAVCNIRKGDRMVETLSLPFVEPEFREWSYANLEESLQLRL